jgi:hypothetical protein
MHVYGDDMSQPMPVPVRRSVMMERPLPQRPLSVVPEETMLPPARFYGRQSASYAGVFDVQQYMVDAPPRAPPRRKFSNSQPFPPY